MRWSEGFMKWDGKGRGEDFQELERGKWTYDVSIE